MAKKDIIEKTNALALPIIEKMGLWHVDTEYVSEGGTDYLRIFIDKPGGVTIDDCVALTEPMNRLLDEHPFIKDAYIFEVSSPGLTRPLKTDKDYERNIGNRVDIRLFEKQDDSKEFTGIIKSFDDESVILDIDGNDLTFKRKNITKMQRTIEF